MYENSYNLRNNMKFYERYIRRKEQPNINCNDGNLYWYILADSHQIFYI